MVSKEIALTFPFLLIAYEWLFFRNAETTWLRKASVYVGLGLVGLLGTVYLVYGYSPLTFLTTVSQPRSYAAWERFLTQGRVFFLYCSLLFYPHPSRLTINHDIVISRDLLDPITTVLSFLGLFALIMMTVLCLKRHRLVAFCSLWFVGNLVIEALAASIEPMFEHRLYLASMFFFVPFVVLLSRIGEGRRRFAVIPATLVILFSVWTYQRNALWNEPITFWEDAVRKSPNHFRPYVSLGASCVDAKQYEKGEAAFQRALTLSPPYPTEIYTNLGLVYHKTGRHAQARQTLNRALELNGANYVALDLLGTIEKEANRNDEALSYYQRALKINPDYAISHHNMGLLYTKTGERQRAVEALTRAIALRPSWSDAYNSLGLALMAQGRAEVALNVLEKAVRCDDKNREALFNLAVTYGISKRHELAARTYERLLKVNPKDVEAMHNLAMLHMEQLKDLSRAVVYFRKALVTDPDYDQAERVKALLSRLSSSP